MDAFSVLFAFLPIMMIALIFVPAILAIVDLVKRHFANDIERILWLLIILFFNPFGAIIYYFMVAKKS